MLVAVKFSQMDNAQLKAHIAAKKDAKENYQRLWQHIVELDETVGLETSTYKELQAKISSKVAQCDKSIQDHEKLLTKINCHCQTEDERHDCYADYNYGS